MMKMMNWKSIKNMKKLLWKVYLALIVMMNFGVIPVYAADDPLVVINNLSSFVFSLIRAIGMIMLGMGIVQVGFSLKSTDGQQRSQGFMTVAGGIVITFAKEILNLITG